MSRFDMRAGGAAQAVAACLVFGVFLALWQRALEAVAGRTLLTLAAFGTVALGGLAAGALAAWWPCRRVRNPAWAAAALALLAACGLVLQLKLAPHVSGLWQQLLVDTSRTASGVLQGVAQTAAAFVAVPCVLAGAAAQLLGQARLRSGRPSAAGGLAACALGVAAGFALGVQLAPALGAERLTRLMALWLGAQAAWALLASGLPMPAPLRWACAVLPLAAVAALSAAWAPSGTRPVLCDGSFGRLAHRDSGFAMGSPVFEHVSRRHAVVAYEDPDYQFVFAVDGRPLIFGNRFHTARAVAGYVPLVARPACARAALVGPDAGVYLPFFIRAGIRELVVAGADRDVVRLELAADAYLTGTNRCEQAAVEYRPRLGRGAGGFDVIFLAPEPCWTRGSAAAVSRASFSRCREALAADGVAALRLDARGLSAGRFAQIARDFMSVFPGVQVWSAGVNDWVLVGASQTIKTPVDRVLALFERDEVFRDFVRAGGVALPELFACMVCDEKGLAKGVEGLAPEGRLEAAALAPLLAAAGGGQPLLPATLEPARQWKAKWALPGEMDVDLYVALMDQVGRTMGARVAAVQALAETAMGKGEASLQSARAAAKISPRDALLIQLAESIELEGRRRIRIGDLKGALKCYENLLSFAAGTARAHYGMGYCLRGNGDNENAYLHFARAVAAAPELVEYRLDLAQAALSAGKFEEADRQFREVLKREPAHAEALFRYAKGLAMRERPDKDYAEAVRLAERACVLTRWQNRDYAFGLADLYLEAGRVLEGMGLKRRLKEGLPSPAAGSEEP